MLAPLKDIASLKIWILEELGAPVVDVELTENHLTNSIDNAIRWFSAKKGIMKQAVIQFIANQSVYPLPDEVGTVTDVTFPSPGFDINSVFDPWLLEGRPIPWTTVGSHGSSMGIYSYWVQTQQYFETARRLMSAENDWRQEGRLLYIITPRSTAGSFLVEYRTGYFTLEQLSEFDHDLIQRSSLARAKKILGRIRSKYDGFPSAQGNVALDGATLLAEASEELAGLDEELSGSGYPLGFLTG